MRRRRFAPGRRVRRLGTPGGRADVAPVAGALADRVGERWLLAVGLLLNAAGYGWLVSVTAADMAYSSMVGPFVLAGVGVSMAIPRAQNAVVSAVAPGAVGKAAGVNSMMRELGGVFGIAVAVAVFAANGENGGVQPFVDGFRPAIAVASGLAVLGAVCGAALPSRARARGAARRPAMAAG
jgi:MFS family permease